MKTSNQVLISFCAAFISGNARVHPTVAVSFLRRDNGACFVHHRRFLRGRTMDETHPSSRVRKRTMIEKLHLQKRSTLSSQSRDDGIMTSPSPWSPGKWKITLHFKRMEDPSSSITSPFDDNSSNNENTASINKSLGDEWGVNSAQLVLSFAILVTANVSSDDKSLPMAQLLGGRPTGSIECIPQTTSSTSSSDDEKDLYHATYVNGEGRQNVRISSGRWRIEPPIPLLVASPNGKTLPGQASTLRFSLVVDSAVRRNSIHFPENQLLLLRSNTFREEQYEHGIRTLLPFQLAKENAQRMLDEQLDHESGDRRLDGADLLPLLEGYKDVAALVWERDERYRKWREIESVLPLIDTMQNNGHYDIDAVLDDEGWGTWPGDTDLLTIERGIIVAVVEKKETRKALSFPWMENGGGGNLETVVVGRWSAVPIWDDGE